MDNSSKDCSSCVAYNVDHCTATKCQGAITVYAHRRSRSQAPIRKLSDEALGKYYDFFFSSFQEGFGQDAEKEHSSD